MALFVVCTSLTYKLHLYSSEPGVSWICFSFDDFEVNMHTSGFEVTIYSILTNQRVLFQIPLVVLFPEISSDNMDDNNISSRASIIQDRVCYGIETCSRS